MCYQCVNPSHTRVHGQRRGGAPGEILYRANPARIRTGRRPHGLAVIPAFAGMTVFLGETLQMLGGIRALSVNRGLPTWL